jgi:hypothetical protein
MEKYPTIPTPSADNQPEAPNTAPKIIQSSVSLTLPATPPTTPGNVPRSQLTSYSGQKDPKQKKRVNYEDGTHDMPDPLLLQLRKRYVIYRCWACLKLTRIFILYSPIHLLDFSADGGESSDEEYVPSGDEEEEPALPELTLQVRNYSVS